MTRDLPMRAFRCVCDTCGFAVMAMSMSALLEAELEHERYVRWLARTDAPILIPPTV